MEVPTHHTQKLYTDYFLFTLWVFKGCFLVLFCFVLFCYCFLITDSCVTKLYTAIADTMRSREVRVRDVTYIVALPQPQFKHLCQVAMRRIGATIHKDIQATWA